MAGTEPPLVSVTGLKDVSRSFKAIDATLPKELRRTTKGIAQQLAPSIEMAARARGSTAAAMARTVRASGTQKGASIRIGVGRNKRGVPYSQYVRGAEWGSDKYEQFEPHERDGKFAFPTVERQQESMRQIAERDIEALIQRAMN